MVRDRHLFHNRENPRLRIIIAVGANAQVDLLGVRVGFVRRGELENARDVIGSGKMGMEITPLDNRLPVRGRERNLLPKFCRRKRNERYSVMVNVSRIPGVDMSGGAIWPTSCFILAAIGLASIDRKKREVWGGINLLGVERNIYAG